MGNSLSPIDEATQTRINELLADATKNFAIEYSKAYTQVVIKIAKEELTPKEDMLGPLKLKSAPPSEMKGKTGILVKRGDVSKSSWKSRFFVMQGEKGNYKVDYYDGTDDKGKLKGSIYCAGLSAYEFSADDIIEFGEPGIKLTPWGWGKRTWYMKCPDDKERKEWLSAFQTACWYAKSPRDQDRAIAEAFDITIKKLRWHYWLWSWYGDSGDEPQRLAEFITDLLERNVLNEVFYKLPDNAMKSMTVDGIRKAVGGSVKAACSSAWLSSSGAVRSVSATVQASVKDLLAPLIEKETKFKETIVEKVSSTVDPFLADKGASLLKPVLDVLFKPVADAFSYAVQDFHSSMKAKIGEDKFNERDYSSALDWTDWEMAYSWWGPQHRAFVLVDRLYDTDLNTVATMCGNVSTYTIYYMVLDKLRMLMRRAVYTFRELAKGIPVAEQSSVLSHVVGLLVHDAYLVVKFVIFSILKAILQNPIAEFVIKPSVALVEPLQKVIDEIPIPGLNILFDLPDMLEEVVTSIQDKAVLAIVGGSLAAVKSKLDEAAATIGLSSISIE